MIFGDKILSCQFFRDYADLEILRNIQPEDIEDVSERYVPLYIVSLIEPKTKVKYNVAMQMLRYMIYRL